MKPTEFQEQNVVLAENQPEYTPLPAFKDPNGIVVSCWELTPEELEKVKETGQIWLSVLTFNKPLQPVYLSPEKSEHITTIEG